MFRDEREALRARAEAALADLDAERRENERLRAELARRDAAPDDPCDEATPEELPERAVVATSPMPSSGALVVRGVVLGVVSIGGGAFVVSGLLDGRPLESVLSLAAIAGELTVFAAFETVRVWLERRDDTWWVTGAIPFRVARAAAVVAVAAGAALATGGRDHVLGMAVLGFVALCIAVAAFAMPEDMTW